MAELFKAEYAAFKSLAYEALADGRAILHSGVIAQKVNECGYNCALC